MANQVRLYRVLRAQFLNHRAFPYGCNSESVEEHVAVFLYLVAKPKDVFETMVTFHFECSKALHGSNKEMTQVPSLPVKDGQAHSLE